MAIIATRTALHEILYLRELFLQENNFQIRYNSRHERGWTDSYLVSYNNEVIGYGSIAGNENHADRDTVFEFYLLPSFRSLTSLAFRQLLMASEARYIECQTNDLLLAALFFEYAGNIKSEVVLFEEGFTSTLELDEVSFRKRKDEDQPFDHKVEPVGNYILEQNSQIVATGGFFLHYNIPFADLYMEVREDCRKRGLGSFLIQELKRQCYLAGRVPAARTDITNSASRATLTKAGLKIAGFMLFGNVKEFEKNDGS